MKKIFLIAVAVFSAFVANAQTPCSFKYGATEEDSLTCAEQITLFRTFYNQKQYAEAYTPWQYVVNSCPCAWSGTFAYATTMLRALIKAEKDSVHREALIDTLIWSQTAYHTYHPKNCTEGKGLGMKAYYSIQYRSNDINVENQAYEDFVTAAEMEKENTQPAVWDMYFQLAVRRTQRTKDTSAVVDAYERAMEYIDDAIINNQAKFEQCLPQFDTLKAKFDRNEIGKMMFDKEIEKLVKDTSNCQKAISGYRKMNKKLEEGFAPYANGEVLLALYEKKFEANKDNIPALKKMLAILSKDSLCQASATYSEILQILYRAEPSGKVALYLGIKEMGNKDYTQSIQYFNEAIRLFTTNEEKSQPYYFIALIESMRGSYSAARGHAMDALRCNPKFGRAYILIGDMYKNSYNQFTSGGNGVIPGAVYWVAADKYNQAQAIDPSLANECARKRAALPKVSGKTLVENNLQPGQSYHVGGWINENTTVK
ncbi:MAG: hypothetical protein K6A95_05125 [Bacteroidales bacterium]|jgi:tetratricopeptide (TPR) repeat protein|nr:hypothetical protein [Bacteroidales bacterium]